MTARKNPLNKVYPLNQLATIWNAETKRENLERHKQKPKEQPKKSKAPCFGGMFRNRDLLKIAMKQGKKVYIKTVDGFVQLSLNY